MPELFIILVASLWPLFFNLSRSFFGYLSNVVHASFYVARPRTLSYPNITPVSPNAQTSSHVMFHL